MPPFHLLLVHSAFPPVLWLSVADALSLPVFKCLVVPGDNCLCSFLLTQQVSVRRGAEETISKSTEWLFQTILCFFHKFWRSPGDRRQVTPMFEWTITISHSYWLDCLHIIHRKAGWRRKSKHLSSTLLSKWMHNFFNGLPWILR